MFFFLLLFETGYLIYNVNNDESFFFFFNMNLIRREINKIHCIAIVVYAGRALYAGLPGANFHKYLHNIQMLLNRFKGVTTVIKLSVRVQWVCRVLNLIKSQQTHSYSRNTSRSGCIISFTPYILCDAAL